MCPTYLSISALRALRLPRTRNLYLTLAKALRLPRSLHLTSRKRCACHDICLRWFARPCPWDLRHVRASIDKIHASDCKSAKPATNAQGPLHTRPHPSPPVSRQSVVRQASRPRKLRRRHQNSQNVTLCCDFYSPATRPRMFSRTPSFFAQDYLQ